jgi:Domain of unknown function (DUF4410)
MSFRSGFGLGRVLAVAALVALGACTTVTVTPEGAMAPKETYKTVVVSFQPPPNDYVGDYGPFFREGLLRRLRELKAFDTIVEAPKKPNGPDALYVSATLTDVDKGNEAVRMLIGFGAGREHASAELDLKTSDGKSLGHLEIRKAYSGGAGIGGAGFITIEDLTKQVGEQAAQSLLDWSQGKDVKRE